MNNITGLKVFHKQIISRYKCGVQAHTNNKRHLTKTLVTKLKYELQMFTTGTSNSERWNLVKIKQE